MTLAMRICVLTFAVLATVASRSASYYVATNGNDGNVGSVSSPFLTIGKGVSVAQAGDVVNVGEGIYAEAVTTARSGSSGSPITLDGQGAASVLRVTLSHQYINLQNLTITGLTNHYSSLLYFNRGAHYCVISNNVVDNNYVTNVYPVSWAAPATTPFSEAGSDNLFVGNTVTGGIGLPVMNIYGDRNVIRGNRLLDGNMVDWFRLWGRSNHIVSNICSNNMNSATGNHPDFIQTFGDNGYGSLGHIIDGNLILKGESMQLNMLSADRVDEIRDWTFRNNLFIDVAYGGPVVIPDVKYYNNVFLRCNTTNGGHAINFTSLTFGEDGTDYAHGAQVINNVFLDCGDSRTSVGWYLIETNLLDVVADYNYVGKNGHQSVQEDPLQRAIGDPGGWDYLCMTWWEPNGINGGDPGFVNEGELNLRLQNTSILIGMALPINQLFTTDFAGTTRGATWDIGAYEYNSTTRRATATTVNAGTVRGP